MSISRENLNEKCVVRCRVIVSIRHHVVWRYVSFIGAYMIYIGGGRGMIVVFA